MDKTLKSIGVIGFISLFVLLAGCQVASEETATATIIPTPIATTTPTPNPSPTAAVLTEVTEIAIPTETELPSSVLSSPTPTYPESHYISAIYGHKQTYELGCEASAAVDWAGYFGVHIFESTFQYALPLSEHPDYGFVGEVTTDAWGQIPPYAYGVHAQPIADVLVDFGLPARAVTNYSIEEVKQKISESKPIIAWVIGNMEYSEPVQYVDNEGRTAIVAPYEHVIILTGYSPTHIRYMNNGLFYDTPIDVFLTSWGVLGNMAVIHD